MPQVVTPLLDSAPVCLACCTPVQGGYHCPGCGWPLCGAQCRHNTAHSVECGVFSRAGVKLDTAGWEWQQPQPLYALVAVLRVAPS